MAKVGFALQITLACTSEELSRTIYTRDAVMSLPIILIVLISQFEEG
jgi:hypothetical protein